MTAPAANGGYGTDIDGLKSAATKVKTVEGDIASTVNKLANDLIPLEQSWVGTASTSFQALRDQLIADAKKMNLVLSDIGTHLEQASGTYSQSEQETFRELNSLDAKLNPPQIV